MYSHFKETCPLFLVDSDIIVVFAVRMCVPQIHYDACIKLVNAHASNVAGLECVSARDRWVS